MLQRAQPNRGSNGYSKKTVVGESGAMEIEVPGIAAGVPIPY